jgi:hypothetical protein
LFVALLWRHDIVSEGQICKLLEQQWQQTGVLALVTFFPMADHYKNEMGEPLKRAIFFMNNSVSRDALVPAKLSCMKLEQSLSREGKRTVNLDPGIICLDQVVLCTTKPFAHRIYLSNNLYAELVYTYIRKQYLPMPWTYPDYCRKQVIDYFLQARLRLS